MKHVKHALVVFSVLCLMGILTVPLSGCREEGPAERTGRAMDEAAEEMRDAAEDIADNY